MEAAPRRGQSAQATGSGRAGNAQRPPGLAPYTIDLVSNIRLLERMPAQQRAEVLDPAVELWRGSIRGMSGSWVRLLRSPRGLYGAMFDGVQLFRITTLGEIRKQLLEPSSLPDGSIVAFSMNDVVVSPGTLSCEVRPALRAPLLRAATRHWIASCARCKCRTSPARPGSSTSAFWSTTPLRGIARDARNRARLCGHCRRDLLGTTWAGAESDEFRHRSCERTPDVRCRRAHGATDYRAATPALQSSGVTYLFTGRSLGADILGLAILNGACGPGWCGCRVVNDAV